MKYLNVLSLLAVTAALSEASVDCSEYQHSMEMPFSGGAVVLDYTVTNGTLSAKLTRQGSGWVAIGFPEDPSCQVCMKGTNAIIGVPGDEPSVLKYDLTGYKTELVVPMEEARQTLSNATVVQDDDKVVVTFVKLLEEDGENMINGNGPNTFLWAMGQEGATSLGYHSLKRKFSLDLSPCVESTIDAEGASSAPIAVAGSAAPSSAPPKDPVAVGRNKYDRDSSTTATSTSASVPLGSMSIAACIVALSAGGSLFL